MTSTASFKERAKQAFSIFKWDFKSCTGTMTVYLILAAVFTTVVLTLCLVVGFGSEGENLLQKSIQVFQYVSTSIVYLLTIIFTIVYTVKVYSYLHNKRKADLYGSLPISRMALFFSKSAAAYLFSIIPALLFLGIISVISICFGQPLVTEVTDVYIKLIVGTLASISAYGLISVCCGTTLNSVIMFIAVCIVYPLSAMFIKGVVGGFFYGTYSGILKDHFIMNALNPLAAYDGINVIYWIIFSAVCIVASAFLVKNRKAERAQASFAYYLPCHIVKVLISFLAGMFLGVLFGSLNVFGIAYLGFVFGFILGSVPAFVISHLIFYKGFSSLLKSAVSLCGLVVVVAIAMAVCTLDVFNYCTYVPNFDDVKSAGFIDTEDCYVGDDDSLFLMTWKACDDFTDRDKINNIITMHNEYLNDKDITDEKKFQNVWYSMFVDNIGLGLNSPEYCFAYKMNDGRTITRAYSPSVFSNSVYSDNLDTSSITLTKEYFENYSAICNAEIDSVSELTITTKGYETACVIDDYVWESDSSVKSKAQANKDAQKILEAFRKDFAADTKTYDAVLTPMKYMSGGSYYYSSVVSGYTIKDFEDKCPDAVCIISLGAKSGETDAFGSLNTILSSSLNYSSIGEEVIIPKSYTNTINALKEAGILNDNLELNSDSEYYDGSSEYFYGDAIVY